MSFARLAAVCALSIAGVALLVGASQAAARPFLGDAVHADSTVYELRRYTAHRGKLPNVLTRFREHTTALLTKHGMVNMGYFTPLDSTDGAGSTLVYFLRHRSRQAAAASWRAFVADPAWSAVAAASEQDGPIVEKIESVFLAGTDYSPEAWTAGPSGARVFELRTYTTPPGRLTHLDARFRQHTMALFAKHGMTNIAYWHPTDSTHGGGHTLVYLLAHASRAQATASWAAFRSDSSWVAVRSASERAAGGSLTTQVRSVFLAPTDFSTVR